MSEPKKCPFCGGQATRSAKNMHGLYQVFCLNEECHASTGWSKDADTRWNRRADHSGEANGIVSSADKIRSMSDEELAEFLLEWVSCDKEGFMCHPKEYKESGKCDGRCIAGRIDWLRQPAKEETE